MRKDDHLIYESLVQSRAPISDEQAAKMITDKIKGTPNLSIPNIKMYVQRYLGLVGKAPSDINFIAAMVHDNLQHMGMGENAESADERKERTQRKWQMNKDRWAKWKKENPEAAAKHAARKAGKSAENAEDSAEDKMRDRENVRDEKRRDTEVSAAFHYDPMPGLMKAANEIRDLLHGAANDEARTEHIIKMAHTILGDPTEYDKNEYRKMLDGLIVILNRFIVVPMNSENAENEPHGYPQGMTAIQNTLINQLKKHGFTLTKISHADKERDKYPTVFMKKSQGAMHKIAEIDGMGYINGESYRDYDPDMS